MSRHAMNCAEFPVNDLVSIGLVLAGVIGLNLSGVTP
jgi:hypothetical protein